MSFKSNTNALNFARRTSSLGTFSNGATLIAHAKLASASDQGVLLQMKTTTGSGNRKYYVFCGSGPAFLGGYGTTGSGDHGDYTASPPASTANWTLFCIRVTSGGAVDISYSADGSSLTSLYSISAGVTGITEISVGTNEDSAFRQTPVNALFAYLSYWPNTRLTDGEVLAEYNRQVPEKAGATIYSPLLDDLLDDSGNGYDLTSSGSSSVGFDAAMPSYVNEGGGGSSLAPKAHYYRMMSA